MGYSYRCTYKTIIQAYSCVLHCTLKSSLTAPACMKIIKLNRNHNIKRQTYRIFFSRARIGYIRVSVWASGHKSVCAWGERETERRKKRDWERGRWVGGGFIVMHRTTCPLLRKKKARKRSHALQRLYSIALIGSTSLSPNGVFACPPLHRKEPGIQATASTMSKICSEVITLKWSLKKQQQQQHGYILAEHSVLGCTIWRGPFYGEYLVLAFALSSTLWSIINMICAFVLQLLVKCVFQ